MAATLCLWVLWNFYRMVRILYCILVGILMWKETPSFFPPSNRNNRGQTKKQQAQWSMRRQVQRETTKTQRPSAHKQQCVITGLENVRSSATFQTFYSGCGFSRARHLTDKIRLHCGPFPLFGVHLKHLLLLLHVYWPSHILSFFSILPEKGRKEEIHVYEHHRHHMTRLLSLLIWTEPASVTLAGKPFLICQFMLKLSRGSEVA